MTSAATCIALVCAMSLCSCADTRGRDWVHVSSPDDPPVSGPSAPNTQPAARSAPKDMRSHTIGTPPDEDPDQTDAKPAAPRPKPLGRSLGVFRNTYYSFPSESDYSGSPVSVFDLACKPIASVPQGFHDAVCVQGSGRLSSGRTISFGKRDCACALVCPRSGQRICYEALDPKRFPWGRGAAGLPIEPLRTIAVDTKLIPLRSNLFIPAFVGMPIPGGGTHDGCFRAEDRGLRVTGSQIDVFAGAESTLRAVNARIPTAQGLEVFADEPRCTSPSP